MTVDHDGKIRMDCSSPYAMAGLVKLKDQYQVAFGNDPDSDRHGIVTPSAGLMNPNHYLAVAIQYLLQHRPHWPASAAVGKTLVSSSMIDRVVADLNRTLCEVPVGFKWFADGLFAGRSVSAAKKAPGPVSSAPTEPSGPPTRTASSQSARRRDHRPHRQRPRRTLLPNSPRVRHAVLHPHRRPGLARAEGRASKSSRPKPLPPPTLAGEKITAKLTRAPGNNAPIGGLKVVTANPAGSPPVPPAPKTFTKSTPRVFKSAAHLQSIVEQAQQIVTRSLGA